MLKRSARVERTEGRAGHGSPNRHRSGNRQGGTDVSEYEVRLYQPFDRRALVFTRTPSAASAASLARRWQVARPECRVSVVETRKPRPYALPVE
jgi:hypothetical protein